MAKSSRHDGAWRRHPGVPWRRAGLPLDGPATKADEAGDWTTTQIETRYGCFLPDLTGLARDLPAASLPKSLYQVRIGPRQGRSLPAPAALCQCRARDERAQFLCCR